MCVHACMHACMHTYIHTYIRTYRGASALKAPIARAAVRDYGNWVDFPTYPKNIQNHTIQDGV